MQAAVLTRAQGRAQPVTPWRQSLVDLSNQIVELIATNEDPERRYLTARETAEDIDHAIRTKLGEQHGRVFDPLIDGR